MMNEQTKSLKSDAASPFDQSLYVYGNRPNVVNYLTAITLDFGATTINLLQISIFENSFIDPNNSMLIEVYDFGAGPFTGANTLNLIFNKLDGNYNIGIRTEDSLNQSALFYLNVNLLNPFSNGSRAIDNSNILINNTPNNQIGTIGGVAGNANGNGVLPNTAYCPSVIICESVTYCLSINICTRPPSATVMCPEPTTVTAGNCA